jgi:hypothetical protein
MATINSINNSPYAHSFCIKLSTDQLNIVGSNWYSRVVLPLDTVVYDPDGVYDPMSGKITLQQSGVWVLGGSCKLTSNYADMQNAQVAIGPSNESWGDFMYLINPARMTFPLSTPYFKQSGIIIDADYQSHLSKGTSLVLSINGYWSTETDVFGVIATDPAWPTMIWGHCIAPDYGLLADI